MPKTRVTMRDIALKAGVHFTTVSRALANHPRIPEETRIRVQAVANELGYAPDPMLSALTVYRSSQRKPSYRGTLAWVVNSPTRHGWRELSPAFVAYMDGAKKKARELGYDIEEFWLKDPEMNWKRASEILYARNIRGLLFPPQSHAKVRVKLDWPKFAAVTFGFTLAWPALHTVATNSFLSVQSAVRHARSLGYRRIGLIMNPYNDMRVNHGWLGGYLVQREQWPRQEQLPVCHEHFSNKKIILAWMKKYKPDAVICHENPTYDNLKAHGYRIPEDVGYLTPTTQGNPPEISGINEQPELMGNVAAGLLISIINRGEWGLAETPQHIYIKGKWYEGKTMPRRNVACAD